MSLLVSFDDLNLRGNNYIFNYLSSNFNAILLEPEIDRIAQVKKWKGQCFFTTSPQIAQEVSGIIPVILYLNDPNESFSRQSNVFNWRQNLATLKSIESIFLSSSTLATHFLSSYRIPCKVQYPYVPKADVSEPSYILHNKALPFMDEINDFAGKESYLQYNSPEDFKRAKLYVHIPEPEEQWHLNILLAHTHGVPCITYQQGCFSEFCTSGDKLIQPGSGARIWINNFKTAIRDHLINSKIVYDLSQRFHSMNEINHSIKKALKDSGLMSNVPAFAEVQNQASLKKDTLKRLQERRTRPKTPPVTLSKQRMIRPSVSSIKYHDYNSVTEFLHNNDYIYAGVGGLGDALLVASTAYADNKDAKIIFGATSSVREPVQQLLETLGFKSLIVHNFNGSAEGQATWNMILEHENCKGSVHIPYGLNYGEWQTNSSLYLDNVIKRMPLIEMVGKLVNPRNTKKVIGLCPRGSDHISTWKQRFLTRDEFQRLVTKLLSYEATVIVFGSESDFNYYGTYRDNNVLFMNSNFAASYPAPKYPISMRHMLTAINACDEIISMDTWLKTYAALAGIPCKVIMSRYFGKFVHDERDPSDKIFLAPVWNFDIIPLSDLF